jgi:ribosomal protein S18 acetylase RimI-like enzyme
LGDIKGTNETKKWFNGFLQQTTRWSTCQTTCDTLWRKFPFVGSHDHPYSHRTSHIDNHGHIGELMTEERTVIRKARPEDAPGIAKVHVDTWRSTYTGIIPDDYLDKLSYDQAENMWRQRISSLEPPGLIYVVEIPEGVIVGFATGGPERTGDHSYDSEIYAIYVLKQFQGRGIGRRLTSAMCQRLTQEGFQSLLIWVLEKNPSRGFYEKLRGENVAEQEIEIGGVSLPEVGYEWEDIRELFEMKM